MNKTDIAKRVAAALETEYKSYKNSELLHIEAVNDGEHDRVPLAPLPTLSVPTEDQLLEAFKGQRLNWWSALFDGRVSLDEAAGMLLGFSQTMTQYAILVSTQKANPRPPISPIKPKLVVASEENPLARKRWVAIAYELVTDFTEMRGDIADWRVSSDGKYRSADLITWAKEKGFVADEVLAAWKAKNKPQTKQQKKRWTREFLIEVEAYRSTNTEAQTAMQFGVSGSLVRRKLREHRESNQPKPTSPFAGLGK